MSSSAAVKKPATRKRLAIALAATVLCGAALFAYSSTASHNAAPDVSFVKLDGQKLALKDLRGKVVMVNFWATDCTTCIGEMPKMIETYNKYHAQGLEFVAVAMSYDPPSYVINYTETRKLPFKVAMDSDDKLAAAFGNVKLTPTTFLIDKNGKIIRRYVGEPAFAELHQLLEKELAAA
ncbi:TlpA family protein disulfide reductase [Oxalobacteraceae bacterium CAVE-383]|nr:TlpA family protein disulfide reductase [Oxalobacteraceae bacterium CAVE-383]